MRRETPIWKITPTSCINSTQAERGSWGWQAQSLPVETSPPGGEGVSDIPEQQSHWHGPRAAVFPMMSFLNGRFCGSCPIPTPALHIRGTWQSQTTWLFVDRSPKYRSYLCFRWKRGCVSLCWMQRLGGALKTHGYGLSRSTDLDGDSHRLFSVLPCH